MNLKSFLQIQTYALKTYILSFYNGSKAVAKLYQKQRNYQIK